MTTWSGPQSLPGYVQQGYVIAGYVSSSPWVAVATVATPTWTQVPQVS